MIPTRDEVPPHDPAPARSSRARELARQAADEYLALLPFAGPSDEALAEANLLLAVARIHDALVEDDAARGIDEREDPARHAGYLLAFEIGRRLAGGTR